MTRLPHLRTMALGALALAGASPLAAQQAVEQARADVRYLASDALQGRGVGTAGLDSAAAYVARRFRAVGLEPGGTEGYFQPFDISASAPAVAHAGIQAAAVRNVVGILPGRGALAGRVVVLGAHYDHLGLGGFGSLDPDSVGVVHNGADDNASGVAALLAAARRLVGHAPAEHRTLVFVAFTGEELGLIGSDYYTKHPARPLDSTYAMINFDMVGRLRGDTLDVIGSGSAEELEGLVQRADAPYHLHLSLVGDPWGRSDHSSFYAQGIPVVHFFTNTHEDYHRTTDDWQKINFAGVVQVADLAADLAWTLATRPTLLTFVDVPEPKPAAGGGYGAYLGTIPDMSDSPGGVRINGVRAGSPAAEAGLTGGDVILRIGDYEVKDLYAMTDALRAYQPGVEVVIVYQRKGVRHETRATLGRRGG